MVGQVNAKIRRYILKVDSYTGGAIFNHFYTRDNVKFGMCGPMRMCLCEHLVTI